MPNAAAAAAPHAVIPPRHSRGSSPPLPPPRLRRCLSAGRDPSSYLVSYIPRTFYSAHEPSGTFFRLQNREGTIECRRASVDIADLRTNRESTFQVVVESRIRGDISHDREFLIGENGKGGSGVNDMFIGARCDGDQNNSDVLTEMVEGIRGGDVVNECGGGATSVGVELISDQFEGFGGGEVRGELLGDRTVADGCGLEKGELVGGEVDGSYDDGKELLGAAGDVAPVEEIEIEDCCRLETREVVGEFCGDDSMNEMTKGAQECFVEYCDRMEEEEPACDRIGNQETEENGQEETLRFGSCKLDVADLPKHLEVDAASEVGLCRQPPSLLTNLSAQLDSVRFNLYQEVEQRKIAEKSLVIAQEHWEKIASIFSLNVSPISPILKGHNEQLKDALQAQVPQDSLVDKFVCESFKRSVFSAERNAAMGLLIESKNNEIALLLEKLQHYKSVNDEMTRKNQELEENCHKRKQRRKRRQKLMWTFIGFSLGTGVTLVASSFGPSIISRVASSLSPSGQT